MQQGAIKRIRREKDIKHIAIVLYLVHQPFIISFHTQPVFLCGKLEFTLQGSMIAILRTMILIGSKPEFGGKSSRRKASLKKILVTDAQIEIQLG